ncbi:MAG: sulfotransferase [Chloroflexi bacterium]|nr:sulfotransferase [Chloroflexota bacterium]
MKSLLKRLQKSTTAKRPQPVIVVSGLPRSGTSMLMKMLEAGGLSVVTDGEREADTDNPKGYYEFERVKQLDKGDTAWVEEAQGKAVKVISALLEHLPPGYEYKVLFMERRMSEVLASQRKMLERRGETSSVDDETLGKLLAKHVQQVKSWLAGQPNFALMTVDYNQMLADPQPYVRRINQFLGGQLNEQAMNEVVDPALYRNRAS